MSKGGEVVDNGVHLSDSFHDDACFVSILLPSQYSFNMRHSPKLITKIGQGKTGRL